MSALNGWTKVGDRINATGQWTIYRHKGVQFADVEQLAQYPAEQPERATKDYTKRADTIRRGGLWLVAPDGRVCGVTFIRPA